MTGYWRGVKGNKETSIEVGVKGFGQASVMFRLEGLYSERMRSNKEHCAV